MVTLLVTMSCVLKLLGNMKLDIFISMEVSNILPAASPLMHMSLCPDNVILARLAGSYAPCPVSALAGHYDEGVIYLRQRVVNVMQSGCRVVSQGGF